MKNIIVIVGGLLLYAVTSDIFAWGFCGLTVEGPNKICRNQKADLLARRSGGDNQGNCRWSRNPEITAGQRIDEGCEASFISDTAGEFWVTGYYERRFDFRCNDVTKIIVTENETGPGCCDLQSVTIDPPTILPKQDGSRVPEGPKEAEVKIVLGAAAPEGGCPVNLEIEAEPLFFDGHDHDGDEPLGELTSQQVLIAEGDTEATVTYRSPFPSGRRKIIASIEGFPDEKVESKVRIRAGSYSLLGSSANYRLTGVTSEHGFNHWAKSTNNARIASMGQAYKALKNATIGINDMSLTNGGLFDIKGVWRTPHRSHRKGTSVDLDRCAKVEGCPVGQPDCKVDEIKCSVSKLVNGRRTREKNVIPGFRNFLKEDMQRLCEAENGQRVNEATHHCEFIN